jgi:hypothetical protein
VKATPLVDIADESKDLSISTEIVAMSFLRFASRYKGINAKVPWPEELLDESTQ